MIITWMGHSSIKIKTVDNVVIYIDPYSGDYDEKADIILVSHDHHDHSNREKIRQAMTEHTVLLTTKEVAADFHGAKVMAYWQKEHIGNIIIESVPAYNIGSDHHPKGYGMGFVIIAEHKIVYFAGDSDLIPEMQQIKAHIALLPVGGTYTMNAKEAAEACFRLHPKIAVPIHYGGIVGHSDDAEAFKELVEEKGHTHVAVLEEGDSIEV